MRSLFPILIAVGILAAGLAWAGPLDPADELYEGARLHVGWVNPAHFDSTLVYGADYLWKNALVTANFFATDGEVSGFDVDLTVWTIEGSYLLRPESDPGMYYGAGVGYVSHAFDVVGFGSTTEGTVLYNVVLGKEFHESDRFGGGVPYVEVRYNFDFGAASLDDIRLPVSGIDGFRLTAGWRF